MRISHTELEVCVKDPRHWYSSAQNKISHGYKMGYERGLRLAVIYYHKTTASDARSYLTKLVKRHDFKNASRITEIENALDSYVNWAVSEHLRAADVHVRIALRLGFFEMRGELGRVDVTAKGYRAVLLQKAPQAWKQQLRMPLIQVAVASMYGRPIQEVEVGFQQLNGNGLETVSFLQPQINAAKKRFVTLGEMVRRLVKSEK